MILSFIVPCYNVEPYVEKCIESLENQDIPKGEYEILAYNDESKDYTLQVLEKLAKKYSNVKVASHKNKGLSGTRNRGIREAQGDFIWFIDSDDWISENCLGKILASITDKTDIVAFSGFIPEGDRNIGADIFGEKVKVKAYLVEPDLFGTCPVYLLTTDIEGNSEWAKRIKFRFRYN